MIDSSVDSEKVDEMYKVKVYGREDAELYDLQA